MTRSAALLPPAPKEKQQTQSHWELVAITDEVRVVGALEASLPMVPIFCAFVLTAVRSG